MAMFFGKLINPDSETPWLDRLNYHLSSFEWQGRLASGIVCGPDVRLMLDTEIQIVRQAGVLTDSLWAGAGSVWGVPVLLVDQPGRLTVVTD